MILLCPHLVETHELIVEILIHTVHCENNHKFQLIVPPCFSSNMFSFLAVRGFVRAALCLFGLVFFSVAQRRTHAEPLSITVFGFLGCCLPERC